MTVPKEQDISKANDLLSMFNQAETLWDQTLTLIESQDADTKLSIYNSDDYKNAHAALLYLKNHVKPVIQKGVSDSAALDNVFELLNKSGQPAPLAKLMLIPDAWSKKNKTLPKSHQQLFNFLNSTMEPWDGPAAIAATDNEWVIAANDRNGLRPLRYAITKYNLLFAGSETGMIELNEKRILSKGRLGPGEIIGVRIEKGKVFKNKQIKDN